MCFKVSAVGGNDGGVSVTANVNRLTTEHTVKVFQVSRHESHFRTVPQLIPQPNQHQQLGEGMQFCDVSHYVSRTNQHRQRGAGIAALRRPRTPTVTEFALESKNSLSNSDQFCAKLLTGKRHRGYEALVDSTVFCASMPTLWVVTKHKGGERGDTFTAQFLPQNNGENCGQISTYLLRCVSHRRLKHPPVCVSLSPNAAHRRRTQEVKAMTTLLSISGVQDRLCVSRSTVNRLIRDRKLECVYIGRSPRIPDDSVEKLISELRTNKPDIHVREIDS
jgi:excisionase family DNA binding protein